MPTVIDSLAIELSLDPKKLQEGLKSVSADVKQNRDDSERHFKVLDGLITNMGRSLAGLIATFVSLEAAIEAFAATKHISKSGTEFANLAETIGMSVNQLGAWEQALERVGGQAAEVGSAFRFQQSELQKTKIHGGAPSFLGYMQRLGLPDWNTYYNASTGSFDLDRFNKDIADAMARRNLTAPQRSEYLKAFGFDSPAAQRLFTPDLRKQLEEAKRTAPTDLNTEAFRKLNEQWTQLSQAITAVQRDLVTNFFQPISAVLKSVNDALESIHKSGWGTFIQQLGDELKKEGIVKFLFYPHVTGERGNRHAVPFSQFFGTSASPSASGSAAAAAGLPSTPGTPLRTRPAPSGGTSVPSITAPFADPLSGYQPPALPSSPSPPISPTVTAPPPQLETPGGAIMIGPRTGVRPPPPATTPPITPTTPPGVPGPQSSAIDQLLTLPQRASVPSVPEASTTYNNTVTTSIGAITFQNPGGQTGDVGAAGPYHAIAQEQFRNASYSVNANSALE